VLFTQFDRLLSSGYLALFISGQKQNGFPFRSRYRRANFCTIRSCVFAKHEESHKVLFSNCKAISIMNKITKGV
jgi:hypothetical protein